MAKSRKVEKSTRRLMEAVGDTVKKKGGKYKFKSKNRKMIKKVKRTCVHWVYRRGREVPTVQQSPDHNNMWKCCICGAEFPQIPLASSDPKRTQYEIEVEKMLGLVNQMQFFSVKLGGDADDTKMFLNLRRDLPRFAKVSKQILKRVNKRNEYETNRAKGDAMARFDVYSGFNYRM